MIDKVNFSDLKLVKVGDFWSLRDQYYDLKDREDADSQELAKLQDNLFQIATEVAEDGYADAQYWLGHAYVFGRHGVEQNVDRGIELLAEAAEQNQAFAILELSNIFCGQFSEHVSGEYHDEVREQKYSDMRVSEADLCDYYDINVIRDETDNKKVKYEGEKGDFFLAGSHLSSGRCVAANRRKAIVFLQKAYRLNRSDKESFDPVFGERVKIWMASALYSQPQKKENYKEAFERVIKAVELMTPHINSQDEYNRSMVINFLRNHCDHQDFGKILFRVVDRDQAKYSVRSPFERLISNLIVLKHSRRMKIKKRLQKAA